MDQRWRLSCRWKANNEIAFYFYIYSIDIKVQSKFWLEYVTKNLTYDDYIIRKMTNQTFLCFRNRYFSYLAYYGNWISLGLFNRKFIKTYVHFFNCLRYNIFIIFIATTICLIIQEKEKEISSHKNIYGGRTCMNKQPLLI